MVQCVVGKVVVSDSVWRLIKVLVYNHFSCQVTFVQEFSVGEEVNFKFVNLQQTEAIQAPTDIEIEYEPEMAQWMKLCITALTSCML